MFIYLCTTVTNRLVGSRFPGQSWKSHCDSRARARTLANEIESDVGTPQKGSKSESGSIYDPTIDVRKGNKHPWLVVYLPLRKSESLKLLYIYIIHICNDIPFQDGILLSYLFRGCYGYPQLQLSPQVMISHQAIPTPRPHFVDQSKTQMKMNE